MKRKSFIARGSLALCSGQGKFLVTDGMQKDRKVFADGGKSSIHHLSNRSTDDYKIPITRRMSHQGIANRATYTEDLNRPREFF